MKITEKYVFFQRGIFSNWTKAPFCDPTNGLAFANSEQYFMYRKAILFGDTEMASEILKQGRSPMKAKVLGRKVRGFDPKKWDEEKYEIMKEANRLKYSQNPDLLKELISFGDRTIVEASPRDHIWGIGLGEDDPGLENEQNWRGQNLLGKVLTELAKEFRAARPS